MIKVVGVSFEDSKQIYYFDPRELELKRNATVIVQTERGKQFGIVELPPFEVEENTLKAALKEVVRVSSQSDDAKHQQNIEDAVEALKCCKELVVKYKLKMQIMDSTFTFDKNQLLFRFIADSRIDFRELAKELANKYKTRIELRQIGVRDKAKEIGGCGLCGRELCCTRFNSGDFGAVSINMAKNQNLSLNPSKINGVCGRLLCCLRYEDENYACCRKGLPAIGNFVETPKGKGKVIALDIISQKYSVSIPDVGVIEVKYNGSN